MLNDYISPPTAFFIRYKEKFYSTTRVDTFERYKDDLKLYALLLASQPKPTEIVEWETKKIGIEKRDKA